MSIWDKRINKSIPTPLYFQVEQIIREGIISGELKPGDSIPTEQELVEMYGVSRATIRQAILNLVNDGYLRREKSKGTFVTKPPERIHLFESLRWFSRYLEKSGIRISTKILEQDVIPTDPEVAALLQLKPGELVFYVKRMRILNGTPYLVDEHFVPYKRCEGIEDIYKEGNSLYNTLEESFGIFLDHGWREFKPNLPTPEDVELLEIFSNTPILEVRSVINDRENRPVDFFIARIHGSFSVDVALR